MRGRRLAAAIARLTDDARVDQASLNDRLARMTAYESGGDQGRAEDLGAELRWAAEILAVPELASVAFSESPDLTVKLQSAEGAKEVGAFEVRRLRAKSEDAEDEERLLRAGVSGRAVVYGNPAEFQDMVARAVKKKLATASPAVNQVLVLVSDSPHGIEDYELRAGAREAVINHDPAALPYGAIICWWTLALRPRWCVPGGASLLTRGFRGFLGEIPLLRWWA